MATALFRAPAARSALRVARTATATQAGLAGVTFTRGKATLPDLPCMINPPRMLPFHLKKYRKEDKLT
jgi:hypothetical protein